MTPASGVATALSWSQADDLLSYSGPDASGATSGTVTESYGYDGDGLRQTKVTGTQKTHEAYDLSGDLPLMITDGPTAYVTGPGGLPLEQVTAAGTVRWFHHDQLGSTTSLTDAAGATVQSYTYDAYGQPTGATPTVENPFRYAGQYTDDTTGFQNLRARYYDPTTGQFLSRDPIEDTTLQPYAYAGNDPTNASDPSGLWPWSTISNAAAGTLDGLTGGLSTRLAAAYFHFDAECADFGAGFGTGQMLGTVGGFFTGGGEAAAATRGIKTSAGRFGAAARRFAADESGAARLPTKTAWGWTGTKAYRGAVSEIDAGGTLKTVGGHVPSQAEAQMLIDDAGGVVQRIEGAHLPPNPHQYPHINYTTRSGGRGTVQIR